MLNRKDVKHLTWFTTLVLSCVQVAASAQTPFPMTLPPVTPPAAEVDAGSAAEPAGDDDLLDDIECVDTCIEDSEFECVEAPLDHCLASSRRTRYRRRRENLDRRPLDSDMPRLDDRDRDLRPQDERDDWERMFYDLDPLEWRDNNWFRPGTTPDDFGPYYCFDPLKPAGAACQI